MSTLKFRIRIFFQYKDLLTELIKRDIKLKYRRSFLGYVWSVLNPLLIMIVMTVVFSAMFKRNIENYPIYLLTGRTLFEFMRTGTQKGLKSVTQNSLLMKKTYIPKYIFTVATVSCVFVDTVFSMAAFFIVMIATRSPFYVELFYLPVVLILLYLFTLGLSFWLAELHVFFRDIEYIYHAVCTIWMYLSALFYPIESLPHLVQVFVKTVNPMYYFIAQFRDIALYGRMPGMRLIVGGWIWAFGLMAFGLYMFQRNKDKFVLYL